MKLKTSSKKCLKLVFLVLSICLLTFTVQAQKENSVNQDYQTLFGPETSHGGYGGLTMGITRIDNKEALSVGVRGAWIVNHYLGIGVFGKGFVSEFNSEILPQNNYSFLGGGYGGMLIEPIVLGMRPVNVSFPIMLGAGGVAFESGEYNEYIDYYNSYLHDYDLFFVVEPGVEVQFNLTDFFRLAVGAQYRFTTETELSTTYNNQDIAVLDKGDLDNLSVNVTFKFGKF